MARRARDLVLDIIASAREAGTAPAHDARARIAEWLQELGFQVEEHPFQFNAGMYRAFPVAAIMLALVTVAIAALLAIPGLPWGALAMLVAGYASIGIIARRIMHHPLAASDVRKDANLVARRPGPAPTRWLVAHLDTKAQRQSMAGRLAGLWSILMLSLVLVALCGWRVAGALPWPAAIAALVAGGLASWLVGLGRLEGGSPGARDNGSGLLAVLTAAESSLSPSTGVVITGAEEFALAGARALVRDHASLFSGRAIINVDTVDDAGKLYLLRHRAADDQLATRIASTLQDLGSAVIRRVPRGVMVDSQPFALVAGEVVTVARLSWSTLQRVHTTRDDARDFRLEGAERVGQALADAI